MAESNSLAPRLSDASMSANPAALKCGSPYDAVVVPIAMSTTAKVFRYEGLRSAPRHTAAHRVRHGVTAFSTFT